MDFDETATVSPVVGDGQEARRLVRVGDWTLTAWVGQGDEEPRIRDLDLAERLGYTTPRNIRKLIKDLRVAGKLNDIAHRDVQERSSGQVAARPAREFWLTEAQAIKLIAKSDTATADAILDEVIRVFVLARRGLLGGRTVSDADAIANAIATAVAPVARAVESLTVFVSGLEARTKAMEARAVVAKPSDDAPGIGSAGAAKILATLRVIASAKAGAIGQGGNAKAKARIRFIEERTLRRELRYPMDRGCSWRKLSEEQFGRAMLILERMDAEASDLARLAARDAGPLFRAVPNPKKTG